jgi:hypothetical protein
MTITMQELFLFCERNSDNELDLEEFQRKALQWVYQFKGTTLHFSLQSAVEKSRGRSVSGRIGFICGYLDQAYFNIYGEYPE